MTTTGTDAAFFDLLDPGFRYDTAQVRAAAAASRYARTPTGIVVLRYRECAALMRDRRNVETLAKWGVESGPFARWMRGLHCRDGRGRWRLGAKFARDADCEVSGHSQRGRVQRCSICSSTRVWRCWSGTGSRSG